MADSTTPLAGPLPPRRGHARHRGDPGGRDGAVRAFTLAVMVVQFLLSLVLYANFDPAMPGLQAATRAPWIPAWGVSYIIGLDGYNILLVVLTTFLGPLVTAGAFSAITKEVKLFYAMVFLIQFAMLGTFVAQDLFLFYLFWETMLIPMFLIIGIWGGERRIYATVKFFLYTAFGSILMLAAVIYLVWTLWQTTGITSFAFADLYKARLPLDAAAVAARRLRAVLRDQGADGAVPHVAAGRARRGADRRLRDPRGRAPQDGHVRLHEAGLPASSPTPRGSRPRSSPGSPC